MTEQDVLNLLADASRREREVDSCGGWVKPPSKIAAKVVILLRKGLVENNGAGYYRPTQKGIAKANPVPETSVH